MLEGFRSSVGGTDVFDLAQKRLSWLDRREQVLASNVANADTPDYVAQDVEPFGSVLAQYETELATTSERHIQARGSGARRRFDGNGGDRSLNGNGVSLENQLQIVAETSDQQRFATNVYSAYRSMLNSVLGK